MILLIPQSIRISIKYQLKVDFNVITLIAEKVSLEKAGSKPIYIYIWEPNHLDAHFLDV